MSDHGRSLLIILLFLLFLLFLLPIFYGFRQQGELSLIEGVSRKKREDTKTSPQSELEPGPLAQESSDFPPELSASLIMPDHGRLCLIMPDHGRSCPIIPYRSRS